MTHTHVLTYVLEANWKPHAFDNGWLSLVSLLYFCCAAWGTFWGTILDICILNCKYNVNIYRSESLFRSSGIFHLR